MYRTLKLAVLNRLHNILSRAICRNAGHQYSALELTAAPNTHNWFIANSGNYVRCQRCGDVRFDLWTTNSSSNTDNITVYSTTAD